MSDTQNFKSSSEYTRDDNSEIDDLMNGIDPRLETAKTGFEGDLEAMTYDEALMLLGGFGRAQWLVMFIITYGVTSGGSILYGLTFLTKFPAYECRKYYTGYDTYKWGPCERKEICDSAMPK